MNHLKGVSVIICCYNSSGRITPTLEHLQRIQPGDIHWEVILVDNNSTDNTSAVAEQVWKNNQVTTMKIIKESSPGLMYARKKGVSESSFDIVSFIDDDNWVDENWVTNVYKIFHNDLTVGACGGESIPIFESTPPVWFTEFQNSFAVGKQQEQTGYVDNKKGYLWGAGLSIRRNAWTELFEKGFISRLSGRKGASLSAGEDSEICFALIRSGWKLWYDNSLKLKHYIPAARLTEDYLKKMYNGFGKAEMILSVYRNSIVNKHSSWLLLVLLSAKQLCRSLFKSIFSSESKFKNRIIHVHDKAYLFELLKGRTTFYNTIKSVKAEQKINLSV